MKNYEIDKLFNQLKERLIKAFAEEEEVIVSVVNSLIELNLTGKLAFFEESKSSVLSLIFEEDTTLNIHKEEILSIDESESDYFLEGKYTGFIKISFMEV